MAEPRQPIWRRRSEALRRSASTPRDLFSRDMTGITKSKSVDENCSFLWVSNIFAEHCQKRGMAGFNMNMYQPVDEEFIKETGIDVDAKKRENGVPVLGDMKLYWAPKDLVKEQYDFWSSLGVHRSNEAQNALRENIDKVAAALAPGAPDTGLIGEFETSQAKLNLETGEVLRDRHERDLAGIGSSKIK